MEGTKYRYHNVAQQHGESKIDMEVCMCEECPLLLVKVFIIKLY